MANTGGGVGPRLMRPLPGMYGNRMMASRLGADPNAMMDPGYMAMVLGMSQGQDQGGGTGLMYQGSGPVSNALANIHNRGVEQDRQQAEVQQLSEFRQDYQSGLTGGKDPAVAFHDAIIKDPLRLMVAHKYGLMDDMDKLGKFMHENIMNKSAEAALGKANSYDVIDAQGKHFLRVYGPDGKPTHITQLDDKYKPVQNNKTGQTWMINPENPNDRYQLSPAVIEGHTIPVTRDDPDNPGHQQAGTFDTWKTGSSAYDWSQAQDVTKMGTPGKAGTPGSKATKLNAQSKNIMENLDQLDEILARASDPAFRDVTGLFTGPTTYLAGKKLGVGQTSQQWTNIRDQLHAQVARMGNITTPRGSKLIAQEYMDQVPDMTDATSDIFDTTIPNLKLMARQARADYISEMQANKEPIPDEILARAKTNGSDPETMRALADARNKLNAAPDKLTNNDFQILAGEYANLPLFERTKASTALRQRGKLPMAGGNAASPQPAPASPASAAGGAPPQINLPTMGQ